MIRVAIIVSYVKQPLSKRPKIGFQDQLSLNAGQKYCRMFHSAVLSTFIKLPFVIKIFVLSIFEWPFYTGFTVYLGIFINLLPFLAHLSLRLKISYRDCWMSVIKNCLKKIGWILTNFGKQLVPA